MLRVLCVLLVNATAWCMLACLRACGRACFVCLRVLACLRAGGRACIRCFRFRFNFRVLSTASNIIIRLFFSSVGMSVRARGCVQKACLRGNEGFLGE